MQKKRFCGDDVHNNHPTEVVQQLIGAHHHYGEGPGVINIMICIDKKTNMTPPPGRIAKKGGDIPSNTYRTII